MFIPKKLRARQIKLTVEIKYITLRYVLRNFVPKNVAAKNIVYNLARKLILAGIEVSVNTMLCKTKRAMNFFLSEQKSN